VPLYEYYCDRCDRVFEALRAIRDSDVPTPCPGCGREADRIMPTTFASMSHRGGWAQRVPFHHAPVRADAKGKRAIARVKPKVGKKRSEERAPKR
jgi:putative FmdB family regulatory protein